MRRSRAAILATAALTLTTASAADARDHGHGVSASKLERSVTVRGIVKHQRALQRIADMNGDTRHTKTPGYTASVAYVAERMRRAGLDVQVTEFDMPDWHETAPPVFQQLSPTARTYTPGTATDDNQPTVDYIAFEHSPTEAVASAPVVPTNDIKIPPAEANTSGCERGDFPAATSGAISLVQRGTCGIANKLANAEAAGAVGVIMFNEAVPGRLNAVFRAAPPNFEIPAVTSSYAVGKELYDAYQAGDAPTVRLETNGVDVEHLYPQVVAETRKGNPRHVVLAGAHLDSVTAGPGINDDGSGSAWQLELAEQISKLRAKPKHKIRFLWFGGEEDGLIGSQYYAAHLTEREVANIDVMIDTDMIASANYVRYVYDGNSDRGRAAARAGGLGSGRGGLQALLPPSRHGHGADGLRRSVGLRRVHQPRDPGGGIFAGAEAPKMAAGRLFGGVEGEQLDPCYHEDCDTLATVTGQPPATTMKVYEADPTPANLAIAQQQADSLQGNALKSLREDVGRRHAHALVLRADQAGAADAHRRATSAGAEAHVRVQAARSLDRPLSAAWLEWGAAHAAPRAGGATPPSRRPAPPGAARSGGSCRSASSAARRRTRSCAGRRRPTGGRGRRP